jgi:hypothetical protein
MQCIYDLLLLATKKSCIKNYDQTFRTNLAEIHYSAGYHFPVEAD